MKPYLKRMNSQYVLTTIVALAMILVMIMSDVVSSGGGEPSGQEKREGSGPGAADAWRLAYPAGSRGALESEVQERETVRVIVGLRVDFQPEGGLSRSAAAVQRVNIAGTQDRLLARLAPYRIGGVKRYSSIPFIAMEVDAAGLNALREAPEAASIVPDKLQELSLAESSALIGAPAAWAAGYTGAGQTVAIIDTGVAKTHSFLADKVVSEACYSTANSQTTSLCPGGVASSTADGSGVNCDSTVSGCDHGTHVAGIAAGKGTSFSGIAPEAKIIAVMAASKMRTCPPAPGSCLGLYVSDVLMGMQRVYDLRNDFSIAAVNLSLGGGAPAVNCDAAEAAYKAMIDNLRSAGIATVVASGNESNENGLSRPACISSAVSVGSSGDGSGGSTVDRISSFSNGATSLRLLAPGEWISSSLPGGGFSAFRGTSMAAPHVAGSFAVLKSKTPGASVEQLLQSLTSTGAGLSDSRNGTTKPRIRADAASAALASFPCSYTISSPAQSFGRSGGTGIVNVSTGSGCAWTAASDVPWVSISSGGSGTSNGTVGLTVAVNSGFDRTGTVSIAGRTLVVTQTGAPALAVDDGSFENAVGLSSGGTLTAVNRLTPSSYPASIDTVGIFFQSGLGAPKGTTVTVLYGVNETGGSDISNVVLKSVSGTVGALDDFNVFQIPQTSIASGDFVVGFRITQPASRFPVAIDQSSSRKRRSYLSTGGAFVLVDDASTSLAGNFGIRALLASKAVITAGSSIVSESCATANQAVDPGETVTVDLALRNAGTENLTNLVATLQSGDGVTNPSGSQSYGAMAVGGGPVSRRFTFTAGGSCGGEVSATLKLQEGGADIGTAIFNYRTGTVSPYAVTNLYSHVGAAVPIPDGGAVEVPITITDAGAISDLNVRVRINHTFNSDLDIYLVGPDGTTVELSTDNGGSGDNYGSGSNSCSGVFTVFDDSAGTTITSGSSPFAGTYRPEGMLTAFNGKSVSGVWKLRVSDDDPQATGTLGCWQLEIVRRQVICCGSTCPIVTGINPVVSGIGTAVTLTGMNLAGVTSVRFANNVNANFTINSATQITATVPSGAVTGPVTISRSGCPDFQTDFTVVLCPTVSGISPARGSAGSTVTINGTNLTGVSGVRFANNVSAVFTVNSATQITATVPAGATSGPITISKSGCGDIQVANFTVCATISLDPASLPSGAPGNLYNQTISASGGAAPYSYSVISGSLPTGMTLSSGGLLSGTPTRSGSYTFTVGVTDAAGCMGSRSYTLAINCAVAITLSPAILPDGSIDRPYNQALTASGGTGPYSFAVTAGTLPGGLGLSSTGVLSGNPFDSGTFNFTVTGTDASGCTGSRGYALNITAGPESQTGILYVLHENAGGNRIFGFTVNEMTGALTLLEGFPILTGGNGGNAIDGLAVDRGNRRLYALNNGSSTVSAFQIDPATGRLTPLPFSPISLGSGNWVVLGLHPGGTPLVVSDIGASGVAAGRLASYSITQTTASQASGSPYSTGATEAFSIAYSRDGNYLYAGGNTGASIAGYTVNAGTGALTPLSGSPFSSGGNFPVAYATDATGRLFAANGTAGQVRVFTTSNGQPAAVAGNPFTSGLSLAVDGLWHPDGYYLVSDLIGSRVGVYRIDGSGSATTLTAAPGSPFAAGGIATNGLAINRTGRFLFAANSTSRNLTTFAFTASTGGLSQINLQPANTLGSLGLVSGLEYIPLPVATGGNCLAPPAGMVGWWPGDGNPNDLVGTNHGILRNGATTGGAGKVGLGFSFDGQDDYVEIPDAAAIKPAAVTVDAWVRFNSLDSSGAWQPGLQYIVIKRNSRPTEFEGYSLSKMRIGGTDRLCFGVTSAFGTQVQACSINSVMTGVFYHVAGTYDGSSARLYLNGMLQEEKFSGFPLDYGTGPLLIGSSGDPAYDGRMQGIVDEVEIFNRALSEQEIKAIYSADSAGKCKSTQSCPTVSGINPTSGTSGSMVTITGANLTGVTAVRFGGGVAAQFTINSATQITALVPPGAASGPVTITRSGCPDVMTAAFTIVCPTIAVGPTMLPMGTRNTGYSQNLTASGGAAPYAFSISSGSLPAGLTLSSAGQLSGTPTQSGSFNFTVLATDAGGCMGTRAYTLTINVDCQVISISPTTLPDGRAGVSYSQTLTAAGGTAPYAYAVTSGALPAGLTLTGSGALSGMPGAAGLFNFAVSATDANGCIGTRTYTMSIQTACHAVTSISPTSGVAGATVAITGTGLTGVSSVRFANNLAAQFTVESDMRITATVPAGVVTGPITLSKQGCTDVQTGVFTVPNCSYSLSLNYRPSIPASSGTAFVDVITEAGCPWTAVSNVSWLTITSGSEGIGAGRVDFSIAQNTGNTDRTGTMTIAGQTYTEWQSSPLCPTVTSMSPSSGRAGTEVTLNGIGLVGVRPVSFSNNLLATFTLLSDSRIVARVPDNAVTGPISLSKFSCPVYQTGVFMVGDANPVPTITTLSPGVAAAGSGAFMLVVTGANYIDGSIVRWNNVDRPTTRVSATQLTAQIAAADMAVAGRASVTVRNPEPGGGISNEAIFIIANPVANVSAASFMGGMFAPDSIVAAFGVGLATDTVVSQTQPLPTSLAGTIIRIRDRAGFESLAPLFFVSPTQINYLIPTGVIPGEATVTVISGDGTVSYAAILITPVAPALFSADASGQGVATGIAVRVKPNGSQIYEPISKYDEAQQKFVPVPIDLSIEADRVILILFGSGFRNRSSLSSAVVTIGGLDMPVLYAGDSPGFTGLDQLNVELLKSLRGRGDVEINMIVDGKTANRVVISIKL